MSLATPEAFKDNPSRVWQFYHERRVKCVCSPKQPPLEAHDCISEHIVQPRTRPTTLSQRSRAQLWYPGSPPLSKPGFLRHSSSRKTSMASLRARSRRCLLTSEQLARRTYYRCTAPSLSPAAQTVSMGSSTSMFLCAPLLVNTIWTKTTTYPSRSCPNAAVKVGTARKKMGTAVVS